MLGMQAAGEDAKNTGFKKSNGGTGSVPCPVCKTGTLRYSVAGVQRPSRAVDARRRVVSRGCSDAL